MIGKGNVVEIVIGIVGIEGAPAAIFALQPVDPFGAARDGLAVICAGVDLPGGAVQGHHHHGGIVQIGVMVVAILEGPAAGAHIGLLVGPVAFDIQHLQAASASPARA